MWQLHLTVLKIEAAGRAVIENAAPGAFPLISRAFRSRREQLLIFLLRQTVVSPAIISLPLSNPWKGVFTRLRGNVANCCIQMCHVAHSLALKTLPTHDRLEKTAGQIPVDAG